MPVSRWRQRSWDVITPLEVEYRDKPYEEFKKALRAAYPFGVRQYTPYKIWLEEQRFALARHPGAPEPELPPWLRGESE